MKQIGDELVVTLEVQVADVEEDYVVAGFGALAKNVDRAAVAVKEQEFSVGQKRDGGLVAANLATRMLWFLRPEHFPWDQDDGVVLRVSEMTKKIGKCWRARKGMGQG